MGKHSPVAIAPSYMESFQCIGSDCEENCCHGWRVTIDKQTYKKYRTIEIRELNDKMKAVVVLSESSNNPHDHAHIKLNEKGACPFLDEKSLCEIQGKLGSDYLSKTCQTYPRNYSYKNEAISLYASLSCPEAARKALLTPNAMQPIRMTLPFPNASAIHFVSGINYKVESAELVNQLSDYIYDASCFIVRFNHFSAWQAMIVLGLMVQKIEQFIKEQAPDVARASIIERLIQFTNADYLTQAGAFAKTIMVDRSKQIMLLRGVLNLYFSKNAPRSSYKQTILDAMEGLQFDENDLSGSELRYNEADEKWFAPFDEAHSHFLKNYLLNDLGKNIFPIGKSRGLETEFIDLAIRYSLIKMTLVGIAALKKDQFSEADYVRVIYTFSRNIEHNAKFIPEILGLLEQEGMRNIPAATLMMR
jgi:lysine-N-methylase